METMNVLQEPAPFDEVVRQAMYIWQNIFSNAQHQLIPAEEAAKIANKATQEFIKLFKEIV